MVIVYLWCFEYTLSQIVWIDEFHNNYHIGAVKYIQNLSI